MSIESTKAGFEASFKESAFYNRQTQDDKHLNDIIELLDIKPGMKILDLGCGSGYLTFELARVTGTTKSSEATTITGLDIVTETLMQNEVKAREMGTTNVDFVSYDGTTFPFEDNSFDMVVTRYALHHFPDIEASMGEIARVLKDNGVFFVSDPRPNDCDYTRFVDDYMQLKKDGHVKFYTKDEWVQICGSKGLRLVNGFDSQIRFPKKKSTANGFEEVLAKHDKAIIDSYELTQTENEIWVTEQVNNLLFELGRD